MFFYLLILFFFVVLAYTESPFRQRTDFSNNIYVYSFLILFLFSGLRYDVGVDYLSYLELFNDSSVLNENIKEPGFAGLFYIFKRIGVSFFVVNILLSFVIIFFAFKYIRKYSPLIFLSLLIFYSTGQYYFNTFNAVRQAIAIYVFWCSLDLIKNKKVVAYFFCILFISLFFHMSAILLFPLYFVVRRQYGIGIKIATLIGIILGSEIIVQLVGASSYSVYLKFDQFASDVTSTTYFLFFLSCFFFFLSWKYPQYTLDSSIFNNLNYLALLTLTLTIVFRGTPLIMITNRFSYYFTPVYIVLIPVFVSKIQVLTNRRIILGITIVFYAILCYIALYVNGTSNRMIPYQTILNN